MSEHKRVPHGIQRQAAAQKAGTLNLHLETDRTFDLVTYNETIATVNNLRKPDSHPLATAEEVRIALAKITESQGLLVESLKSNTHFASTIEMLQDIHNLSFTDQDASVKEIRAFVNRFVADNFQAIIARPEIDIDTRIRNYVINLAYLSLVHGEPTQRIEEIDFLLDKFQDCWRLQIVGDEEVYDFSLEDLAYFIIAKGEDSQKDKLADQLLLAVTDPSLSVESGKVIALATYAGYSELKDINVFVMDRLVHPLLSRYRLDADTLIEAWRDKGSNDESTRKTYSQEAIGSNLTTITRLESQRPGICSVIMKTFGIRNFARYPDEMLIDLYDQRDNRDIPYGLFILARDNSDGVGLDDMAKVYEKLYKQMSALGYAIRIFESGDKRELARVFLASKKRYSPKISFVVGVGHGSPSAITLEHVHKDGEDLRKVLQQSDFEGKGVKRIGELLTDDCPIVFISCDTGTENGIAKTTSETYPGRKVKAPTEELRVRDIIVSRDTARRLTIEVSNLLPLDPLETFLAEPSASKAA
jgi:hypothetical protein